MAIKAAIYKVKLAISDCDRNYFQSHELTLSCHPSETESRMMVRLLAFALYASDELTFTKGLCADDEPDLWNKNLSGEIEQWISLGQIDEKQLRKSLGRSKQVIIVTYNGHKSSLWWEKNQSKYQQLNHLQIININADEVAAMLDLVSRNMDLQVTIQDSILWLSDSKNIDSQTLIIEPEVWLRSK
ncbi:YaeQ family protein [sulfur-oxidizing endosymbiont of Gigantopelta aegis]|uniref:YaeQ family protein n=1 Tax=sulfur-oxidizing endosymbiont of Gigantopelta aegis TaxID=2794934 RepID=UPI0018DC8572|nr:YaeQ family protein [sulfur-oxidizing endosymbiont of Gigantopelta aegis]